MKIIESEKFNKLVSNESYVSRDKNDTYKLTYVDDEGNEIPEHNSYLFKEAYVPKSLTIEEAKKLYDEVLEGEIK